MYYYSTSPEEILGKTIQVSKSIGVTRLANITGLDSIGIPVYTAVRPNSRSLSLSQGKGLSATSAKISALIESIESYHAENIDTKNCIVSSLEQTKNSNNRFCNYELLPTYKNSFLDKTHEFNWIKGINILSNDELYVPFETVNVDMRPSEQLTRPYYLKCSNGLASGGTQDEAINHGICEVLERDSYSCWTLKPHEIRKRTKVLIETINCETSNDILEKFKKAETKVGIWNITSDSNIPCFLVRVIPKDAPPLCEIAPASGFALHPDKNLALIKALTEAAQSRLTFISGARDDITYNHFKEKSSIHEYNKWNDSISDKEYVNYSDIINYKIDKISDISEILKSSLRSLGLKECIVVDLTKPKFNMPVVKVIVPGLEGSESYSRMNFNIRAQQILELYYKKAQGNA